MGSKESSVKHSDPLSKSGGKTEIPENITKRDDNIMDFESGIDTWVIDKEDSNGSCYALNDMESDCLSFKTIQSFNKENITKLSSAADKTSVRCFRIRKNISYNEISSDSENDFIHKFIAKDGNSSNNDNQQNADDKSAALERDSLSSKEISLYLSELDDSCDNIQESRRERLLSIENVGAVGENKVTDINASPVSFKASFNNLCSTFELTNSEQLLPFDNASTKTSFISDSTDKSLQQNQKRCSLITNPSSIKSKSDFLDSFKTHLSNKKFNNENTSSKETGSLKTYSKHSKTPKEYSAYNQKVFKCSICRHCCSDLLLHKTHLILFHSENKLLNCEYCDYKTSQCANLATHIRVHFQLVCPYCDYQCPSKKSLDSHLLACCEGRKKYQCNKCNYICKSQLKFKKHTQMHLDLNKYKCSDCNLSFKNKTFLRVHVKKHILLKNTYKCVSCQLSFSKKKDLKMHLRSHEQLYMCNVCNYKCTHKERFDIHMKVHNRKYLKCGKCSLIFSRKCNLKLHMQVHFPELKCNYCSFQASNSNELTKHVCIKKLYNVQKRTLNFVGSKIDCELEKNVTSQDLKSNLNPISVENAKKNDLVRKAKNRQFSFKSASEVRKQKPNRRRLLSLRSHLPPRTIEKSVNDKNSDKSVSESRDLDNTFKTQRKRNSVSYKTRNSLKQSSWGINETEEFNLKEQNDLRKGKKRNNIRTIELSSTKVLFNSELTPKEILLEPVRFTNGSYIQCYYQSQPIMSVPNHLERHVRQSTLLSCRLCNYKTNSRRLLQRHTAKSHSWDPAVVSILFS